MPQPDASRSTDFGKDTDPTEGTKVVVEKLSLNMQSTGYKPHDGRLMKAIRKLAGTERKSYKQMHLLNDNVFGPGQLWNLTPGPAKSNSEMESKVEHHLKKAVIDKGLVIDFEAEVDYKNDPVGASDQDIEADPDAYRFQSIKFRAKQYDFDSKASAWVPSKTPSPSVQNINGATINWNWGSLTPLGAKAPITSTDPKLLVSSGIPKKLAAIIANYNKFNKGAYMITGKKDKKGELKGLLVDYLKEEEGYKKVSLPGWDGWKATCVVWR
jgi:hypothetical protein